MLTRESSVTNFNPSRRRVLCAGVLAGAFTACPALAELQVSITGVGANQLPIAVKVFEGSGATGFDAAAVIGADLERSGAFRLIPTGAEGEPENLEKPASLEAFGKLGANALAVGRVSRLPDGRWELTYYLHNTVTGALTDSAVFTTSGNDVRMCAHRIADRIYTNLTGEGPIFASKLVYVAQLARNRYELVISDSDGGNRQAALQSHEPIISPVWSPDGKKISYVSFEDRKPIIYVQELATGARHAICAFRGNNSAPAFSADGGPLAVALSRDGLTQIYLMNANGTGLRRFTKSYGIDTEPCFSADGQWVYFTSDRGGAPQIYRQPLAGGPAERVTFGSSYAISPTVSRDGRYLSYISRIDGRFRTAVMDLTTGQNTLVTTTDRDESPSFAPNGRFLVYATEVNGRGVLGTASVDGRLSTRLTGLGDIREPCWGPILP